MGNFEDGAKIMTTIEPTMQSIHGAKVKHGRPENGASAPIRVKQSTKAKLDDLVRRACKQSAGRRIKPDDLICFSLDLLGDEHIDQICNSALSNKDRLEMLFRKISKEKRGITRDEFLGMLLDGKVSL